MDLSTNHPFTQELDSTLQTPVHRLPNEVLSHIFVQGLTPKEGLWYNDHYDPRRYQVLVGSVCRRWRYVSQSTPELWTILLVRLPSLEHKFHRFMEALSEWLGRSGALDLDISIHGYADDLHANAIILVSNHIHHIRSLHSQYQHFSFAKPFSLYFRPRGSYPSLWM